MSMTAPTTVQTAPAQEAGRPQPQSTVEPPGGPFIRHSQPGRAPQYVVSNVAYAGVVTQPLVARPGYFRSLRCTLSSTGGTGTWATATADAPYNVAGLVQLKDAFGTPLIVAPGYEALKLIPLVSGGYGLLSAADIANMPSYVGPTAAGPGTYTFSTCLPLEFSKGYGLLSAANASLLPTLQWNLNPIGTVLTGVPTGSPVVNIQVDSDFMWLPEGANVEPPGLGTTRQWILQQANPSIAANSATRVQLPRLGGYLDTICIIMRDNTGARTEGYWPSRLQIYVDGVPLIDSTFTELQDDWFNQFGGVARPTGVMAITRKTSLNQLSLGLLDTGEAYLSTNPGTLLEINGAPWGAGTNSPAQMNVLVGQVVPTGAIIQGLPEV